MLTCFLNLFQRWWPRLFLACEQHSVHFSYLGEGGREGEREREREGERGRERDSVCVCERERVRERE